MWNPSEIQNNTVQQAFSRCRSRLRMSMYRTRNPLSVYDILYPFSFLFVPGGRTEEERGRYNMFKTIATPRNVSVEVGVDDLLTELEDVAYPLNIVVINTINNKEVGDAFYEHLKQNGATPLETFTTVLTQSPYHRTQLIYNEVTNNNGHTNKTYYMFTNKMNDIAITRLAACMCVHMCLFGEFTDPVATALLTNNQNNYEALLNEYVEIASASLLQEQIKQTLTEAGGYGSRRTIQRLENNIHSKQQQIQEYLHALNERYAELHELQRSLLGARHEAGTTDELTEFLLANADKITYAKLYDGYLYARYRTPLMYWDEDVFKILRESSNSNPMRPSDAAKQQLIDDIFNTRRVVLWFDSGFQYNLTGNGFNHNNVASTFDGVPAAKGIPNPHHYYYDCWGDNASMIQQAQGRGDNVIAFAQIFAAIAGINLSDNIVLDKFIRDEWSAFKRIKCLELKETNEFISIEEYYARYREAQQIARTTTPTQAQEHPEFPFE